MPGARAAIANRGRGSQARKVRKLILDPVTSARLARVRQHDTSVERVVRRVLHGLGLAFRTVNTELPGSPDIVNRSRRWAIYVHGCFWHAHGGCVRATVPKRNRRFWLEKLATNRARDRRKRRQLQALGYKALVVWQCETDDLVKLARRLRSELPMSARVTRLPTRPRP